MSENISHSLGGFRGAFESEYGRKPTEQEIWNAAIRSWRDLTQQKSSAAKKREGVIADLLMYAGDNGYSHIDYADTMRHAAALLSAPADHIPNAGEMVAALPAGGLTDEQCRDIWHKCCAEWLGAGNNPYLSYARAILAAARSQPVREPLPIERLREIERNQVYNNTATLIDFARAIEAAHGIGGTP